jgi:flagellar biosynthesis protein FliR
MNELIAQLSTLSGLAEPVIWQAALVFVRVGAMIALLPAIGDQMVPVRIKLAVAVGMTLIVMPAVVMDFPPTPGLFGPILAEALAGLILGVGLRMLILGLQTAGTIAAQSTSLSQMFAGTGPEAQPIVSNILVMAALAVFVAMDGLPRAVGLVIASYDLMPAGTVADVRAFTEWEVLRISQVFAMAFSLAAPFVIAALLYNLALGAINRAMPQLMVSFVGAPALALGGIALLTISAPLVLAVWQEAMDAALQQPFGE